MAHRKSAEDQGPLLVDCGNAPEFFANGLARVEVMGSVSRFVLYVQKIVLQEGLPLIEYEVPITLVIPNEAVGPALEMVIQTMGCDLLGAAFSYAKRRLALQ